MFSRHIFAERLSTIRHAHSLSSADLGKACGLSQATISALETGKRAPSIEAICTIADYFNVSVDYLLGGDNQQSATDPLCKQILTLDWQQRKDVAQYINFLLSKQS